jgi:hypothetical protein
MKRWTSLAVALMLAWPMSGLAWGRGGGGLSGGGGMRGSGTCLGTQQRQRLRDGSCLNTGAPQTQEQEREQSREQTRDRDRDRDRDRERDRDGTGTNN